MKSFISLVVIMAFSLFAFTACSQDKSKRPSPPATATVTTNKGVIININYSQPSVKGRTIGKEIATYGEVWRTGANEATVFEVNKNVKIGGKNLKAGKYGLYTIPGENEWTIIFNNKSDLWGSDGYSGNQDALRIVSTPGKAASFMEKMTFNIDKTGKVSLLWGNQKVDFMVE